MSSFSTFLLFDIFEILYVLVSFEVRTENKKKLFTKQKQNILKNIFKTCITFKKITCRFLRLEHVQCTVKKNTICVLSLSPFSLFSRSVVSLHSLSLSPFSLFSLSLSPSLSLSIYQSICLFVYLSVCLFVYLSVYLHIRFSISIPSFFWLVLFSYLFSPVTLSLLWPFSLLILSLLWLFPPPLLQLQVGSGPSKLPTIPNYYQPPLTSILTIMNQY